MVVLLDTNVVSELVRKSLEPAVEAWAESACRRDSDGDGSSPLWPAGRSRKRDPSAV